MLAHAILVPTMEDEVGGHIDNLRKRISHKLATVVIGGHYTFTFDQDGTTQTLPARYLFTFEEIDGVWLITGHHSSRMPSSS